MAACMIVMNFLNFMFSIYLTASHAERRSNWCYIPMARFVQKCKITCTYIAFAHLLLHNQDLPRSFLPPQNVSYSMTPNHDISPQSGVVPCRGCYDYYLRKKTPTAVLLASPREEDLKNKTDRHVSARRWAGCEGDDGTSLLHNSGASLNIIVMKTQCLPSPIPPLLG